MSPTLLDPTNKTSPVLADRASLTKPPQYSSSRPIWLILAVTGLISILISFTRFGPLAAMTYASLPVTIGLFAWRHDWDGTHSQ